MSKLSSSLAALALLANARGAAAQTAPASQSAAELAARDPNAAVIAAAGSARTLVRRNGSFAGGRGRASQWTLLALQRFARAPRVEPNAPEQCYVLHAVASAVTPVALTVRADRAVVAQSASISAAGAGGVSSTRFCVAAGATRIEATARSERPTPWAAALVEAPAQRAAVEDRSSAGQSARERLAQVLAADRAGAATNGGDRDGGVAATIELGGRELDFVGRQLREAYASVRGARAHGEASRAAMQTAQEREVRAALEEGRCYEAAAFAVPSVSDVDVSWIDPSGVRVAQDRGHQPSERVRLCPRFSGTYRATLRVFAGTGATVLQVIEVPSS